MRSTTLWQVRRKSRILKELTVELELTVHQLQGDIKIIERFWEVPLDYEQAGDRCEKIRLFGRTAVPVAKEKDNLPTSHFPNSTIN